MIIAATDRSTYLDVSKIEWEPTKFPGVYMKRLYEDPSGKLTTLTKMDPGAVLPDHRHVGLEQSFVIEGALVDEDGTCTAGNFVWRRAGSVSTQTTPDKPFNPWLPPTGRLWRSSLRRPSSKHGMPKSR